MAKITPSDVRKLFDYDPLTGGLSWKPRTPDMFSNGKYGADRVCAAWNARHAGRVPGTANTNGHIQILVHKRLRLAHQLIWAMVTDEWPSMDIDHIDCERSNNKWNNLRLATKVENTANRKATVRNKSGLKCVSFDKKSGRWRTDFTHNGRRRFMGYSDCPAAASFVYQIEADKCIGEFARYM